MHHLKLGIKYQGTPYHLVWINPMPEKKELFIQFISKSNTRKITVPTFKEGDIISESGFWDHLSFHKDGKIHVRTRLKRKKKEYVLNKNIEHSIYDFPNESVVPILSNTYNLNANSHFFKVMKDDDLESNTVMWETEKPMLFTMLIFLAQLSNSNNFYEEYIKPKLKISSKPIIVDMGDRNHCLIVLLTAKIPIEYRNGYINNQFTKMSLNDNNSSLNGAFGILPPYDFLENGLVNQ